MRYRCFLEFHQQTTLIMVGLSRTSVKLASELKKVGVDVIDCSSGGISGSATAARGKRMPGYQVPLRIKLNRTPI